MLAQPVEEGKAAGIVSVAGSSTFLIAEPLHWSGTKRLVAYGERRCEGGTSCPTPKPTPLTLRYKTHAQRSLPHTIPGPTPTSKVQVILLSDHRIPKVRVVPKRKYQPAAVFGMAHFFHLQGKEDAGILSSLGVLSYLPGSDKGEKFSSPSPAKTDIPCPQPQSPRSDLQTDQVAEHVLVLGTDDG